MTTIDMNPVPVNPAVALCVEQARQHQELATGASTDEERRAHEATMRGLDKAAMELVKGNAPRYAGAGVWLVESRTHANTVYRVDLSTQTCNCKNGRSCWHLAAANVCEEMRTMPADALPATTMSEREIVSELDAMLVAEALTFDYPPMPPAEGGWGVLQRGRQWVTCNPLRQGNELACSSESDAELVAGVLNGAPVDIELTRNGTLLVAAGCVLGYASSAKFAAEIERAWTPSQIPF